MPRAWRSARARAASARVIVMPLTTPRSRCRRSPIWAPKSCCTATTTTRPTSARSELARERSLVFVHPFDDPDVIAGQGTIAMEILRQWHGDDIDAIFVPVGGGGLIAGIAAYVKSLYPRIKIIGVEPEDAAGMYESLRAGKRVTLERVGIFADGVAVRRVGEETFRLARQYVDEILLVTTDQICAAIQDIFEDTRSIAEPAGALAVAGIKKYVAREACSGARSGRDQRRREHELRPAAVRRRARGHRRAARGAAGGGDTRGARLVPALLRAARQAQRHRIQLSLQRSARRRRSSSASRLTQGRAERDRAHRACCATRASRCAT